MFDALTLLFGAPSAFVELQVPPAPRVPAVIFTSPAPIVVAPTALVIDLDSGVSLYEKSADVERPIASLTKLMTAIVVREQYRLDDVVTVSRAASLVEPAKAWLQAGEKITVRELLAALLIASANDAALALAEHFPGGTDAFVAAMNAKATALNLHHTHFANPIGFDDVGHYSTARDLSVLASYVLRDTLIAALVATDKAVAHSLDGRLTHPLTSTNKLFGTYLDVRGLKTGSTPEAGECLAALARNSRGVDVLAIVLDSPDRFQEAKVLLEWANTAHRW